MADALQAAGNVINGVGSYEAGKANRKVANMNALDAEREGVQDEARIREAARAAMGEQVAAQGSNGFQIGSGSALDALRQSQINATLDALAARRQAAARARAIRYQGAQAYAQGRNALTVGMIGAASSLAQQFDWGAPPRTAPAPAPSTPTGSGYSSGSWVGPRD